MLGSILPGQGEWIVVLIIALLLFGRRLPGLMRSLGQSVTQFKKGLKDVEDDIDADLDAPGQDEPADKPAPPPDDA